jgi:6-phosphofructokinase 1
MSVSDLDFTIERLGECRIQSPMAGVRFTSDGERVLYHSRLEDLKVWLDAGADPPCGGLCPGLNDVIRAIVLSLHYHYGVKKVHGFRYGYEGLVRRHGHVPLELTPDSISRINELGGTILGSSRGPQEPAEMVQTLKELNIRLLFTIGGDGTLRGAKKISDEARRQGLGISVVGIPKTIDNDVSFVQRTFGFETAVTEARRATYAANAEAEAARNGIGLVKLMGRDSGFIAAYSVLVDSQVNFCLIPEVPFTLERFLAELAGRLERRGHAVVVAAEGAGQDLMARTGEADASGNVKYGDIGIFLRDAMTSHFKRIGVAISLKYIDPSYTIRSLPTTAHDSAFCLLLGHCAVHAGMSGRTNMAVSFWNHQFTHVPISLAVSKRKKIDPDGALWSSVLASTGQPRDMR